MTKHPITENELMALSKAAGVNAARVEGWLTEAGFVVERGTDARPDRLSPYALYRLCSDHGYHIAHSVCANDIKARYPWLSDDEAAAVADKAADHLSEGGDDALDGAIWAAMDRYGHQVSPVLAEAKGESIVGSDGRTWKLEQDGNFDVLICSDGTRWAQEGEEWYKLEE